MKKRVLVCEFHQETNTFNPIVSSLEKFSAAYGYEGEQVFNARMSTPCLLHGAVDAIRDAGGEVIPTFFLTSGSGGRMADSVFDLACERLGYYVRQAGEFDAIYCDLHGATCTETHDDACGDFLKFVRELVGDKLIFASFDLHANITSQVLAYADVVSGFQTYPHVDQYQTGYRAASLGMRKLAGEDIHIAAALIPMLIPPAGYTTLEEPFKSIAAAGKKMVDEGKLLDYTVFAVQPWLDIPEIASTAIAIGCDTETAKACAEELAEMLFDAREDCQPQMLSLDEIIDIAEANKEDKPVVMSYAADSPNGGAAGDSPAVAMRLLERGSQLKAGMFIKDPAAVEQAFRLGIGGEGEFTVGAGYTVGIPGPMKAVGRVRSLHDGDFFAEGPAGRGAKGCLGKSAVVSFGNISVLLCQTPCKTGDPQIFRHFGIEPSMCDLIVVKANTSFRVPYSKISDLIYVADAPGAGSSNLQAMPFQNLPAGLYPFDSVEDFVPKASITR